MVLPEKKPPSAKSKGRPVSPLRHRFEGLISATTKESLTFAGVARELGVSAVTIKRWAKELGHLDRFRHGSPLPAPPQGSGAPTVRDVAEQTGFSTATVSLALRHSSEVRPETAERIREKAREMGYQSHPYVRAHMAAIRKGKPARLKEVLGFLSYGVGDTGLGNKRRIKLLEDCAREMGFLVKVFDLGDEKWSAERLSRHLKDTGVRGLILDLPAFRSRFYPFPYHEFHVVAFREVSGVTLPLILSNAYRNQLQAFARAWELGYRRICRVGFYHRSLEALYEGNASFLLAQEQLCLPEERIPILEMETLTDLLVGWINTGVWEERSHPVPGLNWLKYHAWDLQAGKEKSYYQQSLMEVWWEAFYPDAVITLDNRLKPILEQMGLRIPQDVGLVHLDRNEQSEDWSGIQGRLDVQIRLAVNRLVNLLNRSPEQPNDIDWYIRVPGDWKEGDTLERRTPPRPITIQQQTFLDMVLSR